MNELFLSSILFSNFDSDFSTSIVFVFHCDICAHRTRGYEWRQNKHNHSYYEAYKIKRHNDLTYTLNLYYEHVDIMDHTAGSHKTPNQRCKKRQIYLCYFFQLVLIFGPFWVIFGPFRQFWVIFGLIWVILGHFGAIFLVLIFCGKIRICAI